MAVTPADLLAPAGPVEEELFPDEGDGSDGTDLHARLSAYISRAQAKVSEVAFLDPDAAVQTWALYLTFDAAYLVAASRPATEDMKVEILGSRGYAKDQRDALLDRALAYQHQYQILLNSVPSEVVPVGYTSRQTTNQFEY